MPTYQYVCTECSTPLEVQQAFSDDSLTLCPTCPGRLRKVFTAVGVVFKGSGFYRNDSRPAGSDGADKSDTGADKPGGKDSGKDSSKDSGKEAGKKPGADSESGGSAASGATTKTSGSQTSGSTKKAESAA